MSGAANLLAIVSVLTWINLVAALPFLRAPWRPRIHMAAVLLGVPTLGALTWAFGPIAGLTAFGLGIALLMRRAEPAPADPPATRHVPAE